MPDGVAAAFVSSIATAIIVLSLSAWATSARPHDGQNRLPSGADDPQAGQITAGL
jgi:hypothetical protein